MSKISPGAPPSTSSIAGPRQAMQNIMGLHKRLISIESLLTVFRKESVVVQDNNGASQRREILTAGGGASGGVGSICLLGSLLTNGVDGKYKIKPGYITGGGNAAILLKKEGITPVKDQTLYIKATVTCTVEDGVLLNTFTIDTATIEQSATQPANDVIDADSPSGNIYFVLGTWLDISDPGNPESLEWNNDGCGAFRVKMCSGQPSMVRGDS